MSTTTQTEPMTEVPPEPRIDDDTPIWNSMADRWAKIMGTAAPEAPAPRKAAVRKPRKPPTSKRETTK